MALVGYYKKEQTMQRKPNELIGPQRFYEAPLIGS